MLDVTVRPLARLADVDELELVRVCVQHLVEILNRNLGNLLDRQAFTNPVCHAIFEITGDALDADAGQARPRFLDVLVILSDDHDVLVEPDQPAGPGRELAREPDIDGARHVCAAELPSRACVEHDRAALLQAERLAGPQSPHGRKLSERRCA